MNYLTLAKWIGAGIAALIVIGLLTFGYFTVKGWHDAALQLPVVTKERDDAQAAYKALDGSMTTKMGDISAKLDALDKKRDSTDAAITGDQSKIASRVDALIGSLSHVENPQCVEPQSSRDGMLNLFTNPAAGGKSGAAGGGGQSGPAAGSSSSPHAALALPGWKLAAEDQPGLVVPADGQPGLITQSRSVGRAGRQADRRTANGSGSALPAARLGLWTRARVGISAAARRIAAALSGASAIAAEIVRDDMENA